MSNIPDVIFILADDWQVLYIRGKKITGGHTLDCFTLIQSFAYIQETKSLNLSSLDWSDNIIFEMETEEDWHTICGGLHHSFPDTLSDAIIQYMIPKAE